MPMLLNSLAFLPFEAESTAFWVLLAIIVGSLIFSLRFGGGIGRYLLLNVVCAGATYLLTGLRGELFWFLNVEKVGWLLWIFCYILTSFFFGVIIGNAWAFFKWVFRIFENPMLGVVGLVLSVVWGYLLWRIVPIFFEEHQIVFVLTLIGVIGLANRSMSGPSVSSDAATGQDTENDYSAGGSSDYDGSGFRCCRNCKWNMDRGSFSTRCFQGHEGMASNDSCWEWQKA